MRSPDEYFTWYGTGKYYAEYSVFLSVIDVWTNLSLMSDRTSYIWYGACPWMIEWIEVDE